MLNIQPACDDMQTGKHMLIVEDDPTIGHLLVEAIQDEITCHVLLVSSGEDALNLMQTVVPTLLLLDYHLPGMNGLELVDWLRNREGGEHIPILLMSASLPQGNMDRYHLRMLKKPFNLEMLLQLIAEILLP
ncbi:response regulator [Ktedonobacteria bacterium brp13]|nr:response regulator [Ktedonobacteria bacterium brp13]